jgi:tetratricopeptide (TPR) repeat protein
MSTGSGHSSAQSQADFRVSTTVVNQIIDLTTGGEGGFARTLDAKQFLDLLRKTRKPRRELAARGQGGRTIGMLPLPMDSRLADALVFDGKLAEARVLFEESINDLEALLRRDPANCQALFLLRDSLTRLAEVASHQEKIDESIRHIRRAVLVSEETCRLQASPDAIIALACDREALAIALACQGDMSEARELLRENRGMLQVVPETWGDTRIRSWRVLVHCDFIRMIEGAPSDPTETSSNGEASPLDQLSRLASPEGDRFSVRFGAETAYDALKPASLVHWGPHVHCEAGSFLCLHLSGTASKLRRLGKVDEARRVADRILAIALLMVERDPKRPAGYLALGDAYSQFSKNAWPSEDLDTVEEYLKRAVDATGEAVKLDLDDGHSRSLLARRRQRLAKCQAEKQARERLKPTARQDSSSGIPPRREDRHNPHSRVLLPMLGSVRTLMVRRSGFRISRPCQDSSGTV